MEEKKKGFITKQTIIAAIIGLLIGVAVMLLLGWGLDYFAKSKGIAMLKHGSDTVATVAGKGISAQTLYDRAKLTDGLGNLINEIDKAILNKKYELTDKEKEDAKEEAKYYIDYYTTMGMTEQEFFESNGFKNYDEFLADVEVNIKYTKFVYDYLESKLEKDAVKKYYDEHKDEIESYDTEHILVKISDKVKDEDAKALANEIIGKLNEGKTFDEVVEEYGDKIIHEELGFQGKTANLEQAYLDEMVALKDGEYSKTPIKTSYGYHIVHRLSTATMEDLRGTIIETLSTDLLKEDANLTYKAFVELRKEYNLEIHDEYLKKQYEKYCDTLYKTTEHNH